MRQFYLIYPEISHTPCAKLPEDRAIEKSYTVGAELIPILQGVSGISETLMRKFPLSWSHYRLLIRIDEPFKREFYEAECITGNWSVNSFLSRSFPFYLIFMIGIHKSLQIASAVKLLISLCLGTVADLLVFGL